MLTVNAAQAAKALTFQGVKDSRYYLCGIQIEKHPLSGVYIVSTDGHRMLIQHDPMAVLPADFVSVILDTSSKETQGAVKKAAKFENGRLELDGGHLRTVQRDNDGCKILWQGVDKPTHDAQYPEWRNVVPKPGKLTPGLKGAVNVEYIGDLNLTAGKYAGAYFYQADRDSAILALFPTDPLAFAVIMPIRGSENNTLNGLYSELMPVEPQAQAA